MTELLQPMRKWKTVHGGWQTTMKRCPDCKVLLLAADVLDHEEFHNWLDGLADQLQTAHPEPGTDFEPAELARPPLDARAPGPVARAFAADGPICRAFAGAWLAVFPRRPAPAGLPPPTVRAPAPVPVPSYVQETARRQVERTIERRRRR